MVEVMVVAEHLHLEVQGLDKLWALKSALTIPLEHVRGARIDPEPVQDWWKGIRAPGTYLPGVITAGTFYRHGKKVFWDVHDSDKAIVIELSDDQYDELIVEVDDPEATVKEINRALEARKTATL